MLDPGQTSSTPSYIKFSHRRLQSSGILRIHRKQKELYNVFHCSLLSVSLVQIKELPPSPAVVGVYLPTVFTLIRHWYCRSRDRGY
jgi:hypothetical protein